MKHGSLFSGIGGPDLAAEWMGWENVFHCEWNTFGQRVLKYYWPQAKSYEDITKTDFTIHRGTIDVLTGGFPCQPYSLAGKRKGKEDERHLWPEMLRAIREIQPRWVVGENVLGLVNWNGGMVFDEVQSDLEAQGYEVWPYVLPACAKNAPHRRDRVWFVAYSSSNGYDAKPKKGSYGIGQNNIKSGAQRLGSIKGFGDERITPDTNSGGRHEGDKCKYDNNGERQICKDFKNNGNKVWSEFGSGCNDGNTPNPQSKPSKRMQSKQSKTCEPKQGESGGNCSEMGNGGIVTNTDSRRQPIKEHGQTESGRITKTSVPNNWQNFPTQSPVCNGDDGISSRLDGITFPKWRNESIKAGGNAIVPQVIFEIFKAIEQYEIEINGKQH